MANEVEVIVSSKDNTDGFSGSTKAAKEYGKGLENVGERADKSEQKVLGMKDTVDGVATIMQGPGKQGIAAYLQGWADLASGIANFIVPATQAGVAIVRSAMATEIATVKQKAAAAASKAWAAAQWLLNAALNANPIGLIIVAIALLAAGFVLAWKKSETFRAVMTAVFKAVSLAVIAGARFMLNAILDFVSGVLRVMGKLPGPLGAPFRKAADAVDAFRGKANRALDSAAAKVRSFGQSVNRLPSTKTVVVRVKDLATGTIRSVQREIDRFTGRVIAIQVGRVGIGPRAQAHGGIVGAAGGGPRSRLTMVGEHGKELVDLPPGSRVRSNPDTERFMSGAGGGVVEIEIKSGGSKLDDLIVEIIRKAVRVKGGGNVQIALGRG